MKRIINYLLITLIVFGGCKKSEFDTQINGEALGEFTLKAPDNNTMLVLNSATPANTVIIEWAPSTPGVSTKPVYKWIASLKTGNLDAPLLEIPADNAGATNKLTLTQKAIDDALKAKGIAENIKTDLIWSVTAENGSIKTRAAQTYNISITRMGDGVSNFVLYGPLSTQNVLEINPGSTDKLNFKWQKAVAGKAASAVKYTVKFIKEDGNFNTPAIQFSSNNSGADTTFSITYQDLDKALSDAGFSDQATPSKLKWSVEASSGTFTKFSDYTNNISIVRDVKMFLVGGDTPIGWNPEQALQMIPDTRFPGTFYIYVRLTTGNAGFKFLNQRQWPGGSLNSTDFGKKPGSTNGDAVADGEDNIEVTTPGIYRVTFDQKNLKYYVQQPNPGSIGVVGSFQSLAQYGGSEWQPGAAIKLAYADVNKFIGLVQMNNGSVFKFHDGNEWNNSAPDKARFYGTASEQGVIADYFGDNLKWDGANGLVRVQFDGGDIKKLKYRLTEGNIYVIGAATNGGWDNNENMTDTQRPPLTYKGNGVWEGDVPLSAGEFKFIVKKGSWDFNYGKKGDVIAENGDNLSVSAAGTYTIILNEYTKTYSVKLK